MYQSEQCDTMLSARYHQDTRHVTDIISKHPLEVSFRPYSGKYPRRKVEGSTWRFQHRSKSGSGLTEEQQNPWAVRQAFLDADPAHFPDFVARYGKFARMSMHDLHHSPKDEHFAGETNFRRWQALVGEALTTPKECIGALKRKYPGMAWLLYREIPIEIKWRDGAEGDLPIVPIGVVHLGYVLDAIAFSIQLDQLKGHTHRYCARPDCGKIFPLGYRPEKIYCSLECAHVMAVRKSRGKAGDQKLRKPRTKLGNRTEAKEQ